MCKRDVPSLRLYWNERTLLFFVIRVNFMIYVHPPAPINDERGDNRMQRKERKAEKETGGVTERNGFEGSALGAVACCFTHCPLLHTIELALGPIFYCLSATARTGLLLSIGNNKCYR